MLREETGQFGTGNHKRSNEHRDVRVLYLLTNYIAKKNTKNTEHFKSTKRLRNAPKNPAKA